MTIDKLIIDFLEYMEIEKGRSTNSIANYDHYLQTFSTFAKSSGIDDPEKIDQELIRKYRLALNRGELRSQKWVAERLRHGVIADPVKRTSLNDELTDSKPLSKNTQNYYLIALRSFLKYLSHRDIKTFDGNKIELAKTSERQITFLETEELDAILSKPDLKTIQGIRDKAILDLFFSTGLRVSELAALKITDINLEKSEFSVIGKGGKVRVVFLDSEAKQSLKRYLDARTDKSDWLFISYGHSNKPITNNRLPITDPITPRSIQRMIKKYALAAGITKDVTPHTMRHSFATDLLQNGADLRAVQSLLGHSSVTTTQIYTHVTDQHLQDVHQAFHGLRRNRDNESDNDELENDIDDIDNEKPASSETGEI